MRPSYVDLYGIIRLRVFACMGCSHTYTDQQATRGHSPPVPLSANRVPLVQGESYGFIGSGVWDAQKGGRLVSVGTLVCICYTWFGFCGVWIGSSSPNISIDVIHPKGMWLMSPTHSGVGSSDSKMVPTKVRDPVWQSFQYLPRVVAVDSLGS